MSCGSPLYIAAPISANVVDAETNQPIEGAVVVAMWHLVAGSLDGERDRGYLAVKETLTDKQGRFHFGGFVKANPMMYELRNRDPQILIFKSGYQWAGHVSVYPKANTDTPGIFRRSTADGLTFRLKRIQAQASGTELGLYWGLNVQLTDLIRECRWRKIPQLILHMDREKKLLEKINRRVYTGLIGVDDVRRYSKPECQASLDSLEGLE